jgi:hypothetical protein
VENLLRNRLVADATTQDRNRVHTHSTKPLLSVVRRRQWSEWWYIEGGWLGGGPFDPWEGRRSSDSEKTHPSTRALSLYGPDNPLEGNTSVTQRKQNDSAYYSHCNKTHVTNKTHPNDVRLMFLRIQTTEDPS